MISTQLNRAESTRGTDQESDRTRPPGDAAAKPAGSCTGTARTSPASGLPGAARHRENPGLRSPSLNGLHTIWTRDYWVLLDDQGNGVPFGTDRFLYRPLTTTSLLANELLSQQVIRLAASPSASRSPEDLRRMSFRAVNVLLHAAAAMLVGLWVARWMGSAAGIAAALLVLVHPVATTVINCLTGRADLQVLIGIAGCLAIHKLAHDVGWTWQRRVGMSAFAFLALGSKEVGLLVLPLVAAQAWRMAPPNGGGRRPTGLVWVLAPSALAH